MCVAKTTLALISFAVTVKLICAFVFAYADFWFSYAAAHILKPLHNFGTDVRNSVPISNRYTVIEICIFIYEPKHIDLEIGTGLH